MTVGQLKTILKDVDDDVKLLVYMPWEDDNEEEESSLIEVDHVFTQPLKSDWENNLAKIGEELPAVILRVS